MVIFVLFLFCAWRTINTQVCDSFCPENIYKQWKQKILKMSISLNSFSNFSTAVDVFNLFEPTYICNGVLERYPKDQKMDGGKYVCNLLNSPLSWDSVIYSFGCNNDFSWEEIVKQKFNSRIFTFDCSGNWKAPEGIKFHSWCVDGSNHDGNYFTIKSIMKSLNHTKIDYLKLDIEGGEYDTIKGMLDFEPEGLPLQLSVEVHLVHFEDTHGMRLKSLQKVLSLLKDLDSLGYRLISREDNYLCKLASEFVFLLTNQ